MTLPLPRYVIAKPLASGATGFYFTVRTRYRKMGCTIPNEPLGIDYAVACGVEELRRSMACSMNGGERRTASRSKASFGMAPSIGCFGNTRIANDIGSVCLNAHAKIMNCSWRWFLICQQSVEIA